MGMEIYLGILQYSQKVGNSGNGNEIRGNGNSHDLVISDVYLNFLKTDYCTLKREPLSKFVKFSKMTKNFL